MGPAQPSRSPIIANPPAEPDPLARRTRPGKRGLSRLLAATIHSWKGLRAAWQSEEAFRQEATLALLFLPLSLWVGQTLTHQLLLATACGLVILAELINTAIESIVDRIGPEHDPLSGQAKDLGSAVVLVTLILFLVIWVPSLWQFGQAVLASP